MTAALARLRGRPEAAFFLVILIWGVNFSVMKDAVASLDPLVFNAARFTLSVLFLGLLHRSGRMRGGYSLLPPRALFWRVLGLGFIGHFGYQTCFILGLERTQSGTSALLLASSPLWTGLIGQFGGRDRLPALAWLGVAIAFGGTTLIAISGHQLDFGSEAFGGNALTILSAVFWALYTAGTGPLLAGHSSTAIAFWSMACALPFMWGAALPHLHAHTFAAIDARLATALLYSGVLSSGVAYVLWNVSVRSIGPARTAAAVYLVPVVALLAGSLALGEHITPAQVLGGSVIVLGLTLLRRSRMPAPASS